MRNAVIVSGVRTAIGSFGGGLKSIPAVELGAYVIRDVLKRVGLKPEKSSLMTDIAPDRLKDQGAISLEKDYNMWNWGKQVYIDLAKKYLDEGMSCVQTRLL